VRNRKIATQLRRYPGIRLEGLHETMKTKVTTARVSGQDENQAYVGASPHMPTERQPASSSRLSAAATSSLLYYSSRYVTLSMSNCEGSGFYQVIRCKPKSKQCGICLIKAQRHSDDTYTTHPLQL
jgi:hypothetical protein